MADNINPKAPLATNAMVEIISDKPIYEFDGPGTGYMVKVAPFKKGTVISVVGREGTWIRYSYAGRSNWINTVDSTGKYLVREIASPSSSPSYVDRLLQSEHLTKEDRDQIEKELAKVPINIGNSTTVPPTAAKVETKQAKKEVEELRTPEELGEEEEIPDWYIYAIESTGDNYTNIDDYQKYVTANMSVQSMRGIHGMPYQFLPSADTRLDGTTDLSKFGRKYAERLVVNMPLALISPGVPKFMPTYTSDQQKGMLAAMVEKTSEATFGGLSDSGDILGREGRYFDFIGDLNGYYNHVNPMCRAAAVYLGIGDEQVGEMGVNGSLGRTTNWASNTNDSIQTLTNVSQCVAFYTEAETSVNESFNNGTGESMLASKVNSISDAAREINFLMGYGGSSIGAQMDVLSEDVENSIAEFDAWLDNITGSKFIKTVGHKAITVATGAKMIFPEIWNDSDYSKSHSLKFRFVSPDHDKLSIYLNCLVPMFHLLGFVVPRQATDTPNAYESPYLVRVFYKGIFNIDMGIVTSMSISKGAEGAWTIDGLPTVIEIDMDIKDLYSSLMMTAVDSSLTGVGKMADNIMLLDFIATTCGININKPDITKKVELYASLEAGTLLGAPRRFFYYMESWWANKVLDLYRKF